MYMRRSYTFFNLICLGIMAGFAFACAWVWRGSFLHAKTAEIIPAISFEEAQQNARETAPEARTDNEMSQNDPPERAEEQPEEKKPGSVAQAAVRETQPDQSSQNNPPRVIPARINLAVPFTSQAPERNWSQPWQDACEEAAVLMLDAYYKKYKLSPLFAKDEIIKMVAWEEEEQSWGRSINIEKVKLLLAMYAKLTDREVTIIEDPTVEQIKGYIAGGTPVLAVADGKALPNPHFRNGGPVYHALIIRGYTETEFITNDPGTQFGENFRYTYDELMNAIRDWNGGDVKNGRRTVLVIE